MMMRSPLFYGKSAKIVDFVGYCGRTGSRLSRIEFRINRGQ